jgi:threonine dehydratase
MPSLDLQLSQIRDAHDRIRPFIHRTPVLTCRRLDALVGAELFFKCENFQKIGAFKARGAFNAVLALSDQEANSGVITQSSGNHGAGLALAARTRGVPAYIVMPENASRSKKEAVASYGAQITYGPPGQVAQAEIVAEIAARTGATFIHPFDDLAVIAGQATAAVELIETIEGLDALICPIGGGGLTAGTALAAKYLQPSLRVFAAEPAGADDAWRSFTTGVLAPQPSPRTIADGLLTALSPYTFRIMMEHVDDVLTVSEVKIVEAMRLMWQSMKIVVEPSAAVPLAALLDQAAKLKVDRIGIIVTGGNVDLDHLPWVI